MKKSELNQNIHLSEGNIKSKETDDVMFLTWSLPCKITCPYKTVKCEDFCFAQKNQYFPKVLASRMKNLEETKKDTFIQDMINHLEYHLERPKAQNKIIFVRIHTSGDFYSEDYLEKWIHIAEYFNGNTKILFQAYTKSIKILTKCISCEDKFNDMDISIIDEIIKSINIHFVYSIWSDTNKEDINIANFIGLQIFTAMTKEEIEKQEKDIFICKGDCGNCKQCYTGKVKNIAIPIH